jgi:hypothetical protein
MEVIKMDYKKIFLILFFLILSLNQVFSENLKEECYNYLRENSKYNLISYNDLEKNLAQSNYYKHIKPWDSIQFYEPKIFVKLAGFGDKTTFNYELSKYEAKKFGNLNWPNSYENMYFELYLNENDSSNPNKFLGCGLINIKLNGNKYSFNNLTSDSYWGCLINETIHDYKDYNNYFYKSEKYNCFDFLNDPSINFNVDRVLLNEKDSKINLYEVSKNYMNYYNINKDLDIKGFLDIYLTKVNNYYSFSKDLKFGYLPLDWYVNDLNNLKNRFLFEEINRVYLPTILYYQEVNNIETNNSFLKIVFIETDKEYFKDYLNELSKVDKIYNNSVLIEIEGICKNNSDVNCIGKNLVDYFKTKTDDIYVVNSFVDLIMRDNFDYYKITDDELNEYYENNEFLFYPIVKENEKNNNFKNDLNLEDDNKDKNKSLIIIIFQIFLLFIFLMIIKIKFFNSKK